ncbi:MAG: hypothetical protein ACM30D_05950 [Hyphomicrobiales bacterium]
MTRLLVLMTLALAIASAPTPGEAASQRIHVTAKVVQQTFTGNLASPKLGDRIISNVELFDDSDTKVGSGAGVCTIVSIQKTLPDSLVECLAVAALVREQIIFGGLAAFPEAGAVGHFGILGGTDSFRKARGDATIVVLSNGQFDSILDLE